MSSSFRPLVTSIRPPMHVLWLGNSFIFYNNGLHGHVSYMAEAVDPARAADYVARSVTISGGLLSEQRFSINGMLSYRSWDAVVLQGGSMEALDPATAPAFAAYARRFIKKIRAVNAQPVLFMTWAYADKPEMTEQLCEVYTSLANRTKTFVVPAGLAFADALKRYPSLQLYTDDLKHPTLAGSYLAACAFYGAMYGKSPHGVPYEAGLPRELALWLQDSAWDTVTRFYGWKE